MVLIIQNYEFRERDTDRLAKPANTQGVYGTQEWREDYPALAWTTGKSLPSGREPSHL